MKYLLQITRTNRADRPSESIIYNDSAAADEHRWGDIIQDLADDSFFMLTATNENQLQIVLIKLLTNMPWSPAKILEDEGYRIIRYQHSDKWTQQPNLRPGSVAVVQSFVEDGSLNTSTFGTMAEAQAFVGGLNSADGWTLIDRGDSSSLVIISSPPLWKEEYSSQAVYNAAQFHTLTTRRSG